MKIQESVMIIDKPFNVRFIADISLKDDVYYVQIQQNRDEDGEWRLTLTDVFPLSVKTIEEVYAYVVPMLQIACSLHRAAANPNYFRSPNQFCS